MQPWSYVLQNMTLTWSWWFFNVLWTSIDGWVTTFKNVMNKPELCSPHMWRTRKSQLSSWIILVENVAGLKKANSRQGYAAIVAMDMHSVGFKELGPCVIGVAWGLKHFGKTNCDSTVVWGLVVTPAPGKHMAAQSFCNIEVFGENRHKQRDKQVACWRCVQ